MLRTALSKSGYDSDDGEDILPAIMAQVQELESLESKLEDKGFRRKMVIIFQKHIFSSF